MASEIESLERDRKLASKSTWITGLLTFFIPPVGYLYTERVKALLISLAITVTGIVGMGSSRNSDNPAWGLYMIIGTIENTRAVRQAKKRTFGSVSGNPTQNIKVVILKFIKNNPGSSLSELVIETGLEAKQVLAIVNELERDNLVRGYNRSRDGVVVYQII